MSSKQSVLDNLNLLFPRYDEDEDAMKTLATLRDAVSSVLEYLPRMVLSDLNKLLHLLVDSKRDNAQLWEQVREEIEMLKKHHKDKVKAVRQIYHAVNEKLLRRLIALTGLTEKDFWKKYKTTNIGNIIHHPDLMNMWTTLQKQFKFSESPAQLWSKIYDGKHEFDVFVHTWCCSHFSHYPYQELVDNVVPTVFVGDLQKFEPGFMDVLELDLALTEGTDKDMYEY
jgi:hypothetical protein